MNIIKLSSLTTFINETSTTGIVRLSSHEVWTPTQNGYGNKELCLDLFFHHPSNELFWFNYSVDVLIGPDKQPWTDLGKAIIEAWPELIAKLRRFLENRDLDVRDGMYGISKDILPLRGSLDYFTWNAETKTFEEMIA
jgi:hypothetical protein